ncbi:MAG: hypothetical protein R3C60_14455 [Parvularculaceae bacterium]
MFERQVAIFGGLGALIGGTMFVQADDIKKNYTQVDATIKEVKIDCYLRDGRRKIVEKDTHDLAYMDCTMAPFAAKKFGYSENNIHQRATVAYSFLSPADGNFYKGEFTRSGDVEKYVEGATISVYAHKTEPGKSKTPNDNVFLGKGNV